MQGNRILYDNVDRDDWEKIVLKLKDLGEWSNFYSILEIPGGITLSFDWYPDKNILKCTLEKKPWWKSKWTIQEKIDRIVNSPEIFVR